MKSLLTFCLLLIASACFACDAKTKAGTQCTRKAVINGYCKQHNPERIKCAGKTKAGQPCSLSPSKDGNYCWHHQPKM